MSRTTARRLVALAPALVAGLLWLGLPTEAGAGGKHGHQSKHGYSKHGYGQGHGYKHYEHHGKHHGGRHGYFRGGWGYPFAYGGYWGHRPRHHGYYPAPAAVSVYFDAPCGDYYESWGPFSHHVHDHHGVAFVDLPGLLVQTSFGFEYHR